MAGQPKEQAHNTQAESRSVWPKIRPDGRGVVCHGKTGPIDPSFSLRARPRRLAGFARLSPFNEAQSLR